MAEQIRPDHYNANGKFECIEVMLNVFGEVATYYFCILNVFKYVFRHRKKNGVQDLKKAHWYLEKAISIVDNEKFDWGDSID